uniref:Uncharacterized protein n=2 Tax=Meloidogyne TaxID=189290 RepID=A0A6V7WI27_MELEN|nr:unnamed protein product [Meloidogyne enterolobii]
MADNHTILFCGLKNFNISVLLRAQEESARSAHFRSGNLAIGGQHNQGQVSMSNQEGRSRQRGGASRRGSSRPEDKGKGKMHD